MYDQGMAKDVGLSRGNNLRFTNTHNESSLITIRLVARPLLWLSCTLVYM